MKSESWEFIKFAIKINLRYYPRLFVAPLVGAWRNTQRVLGRMGDEVDEFIAQQDQRGANGGQQPENEVRPTTYQ